jgi:hypothetical protein
MKPKNRLFQNKISKRTRFVKIGILEDFAFHDFKKNIADLGVKTKLFPSSWRETPYQSNHVNLLHPGRV